MISCFSGNELTIIEPITIIQQQFYLRHKNILTEIVDIIFQLAGYCLE